jgi:hypothetical protein
MRLGKRAAVVAAGAALVGALAAPAHAASSTASYSCPSGYLCVDGSDGGWHQYYYCGTYDSRPDGWRALGYINHQTGDVWAHFWDATRGAGTDAPPDNVDHPLFGDVDWVIWQTC